MRAPVAFWTCALLLLSLSPASSVSAEPPHRRISTCPELDRALDRAYVDGAQRIEPVQGPFSEAVVRIGLAAGAQEKAAARRYYELQCAEIAGDLDS